MWKFHCNIWKTIKPNLQKCGYWFNTDVVRCIQINTDSSVIMPAPPESPSINYIDLALYLLWRAWWIFLGPGASLWPTPLLLFILTLFLLFSLQFPLWGWRSLRCCPTVLRHLLLISILQPVTPVAEAFILLQNQAVAGLQILVQPEDERGTITFKWPAWFIRNRSFILKKCRCERLTECTFYESKLHSYLKHWSPPQAV